MMDWIKNRFDQLILTVVAGALLVFAGMVLGKTGQLEERFSEVAASDLSTGGRTVEGVASMATIDATASSVRAGVDHVDRNSHPAHGTEQALHVVLKNPAAAWLPKGQQETVASRDSRRTSS